MPEDLNAAAAAVSAALANRPRGVSEFRLARLARVDAATLEALLASPKHRRRFTRQPEPGTSARPEFAVWRLAPVPAPKAPASKPKRKRKGSSR
jgi:hypothetical protein